MNEMVLFCPSVVYITLVWEYAFQCDLYWADIECD